VHSVLKGQFGRFFQIGPASDINIGRVICQTYDVYIAGWPNLEKSSKLTF
jgi:hypothetical protein